jgi:Domain of unknown function (DUF4839)
MRALSWVVALLFVLGLAACGSHKDRIMPSVTGQKLNIAKSAIKDAGFDDKVKVTGGGLLGVIVDSNWVVCAQAPAAGQALTGPPQLTVARACENTGAASASASASTQSSPARPAADATITVANNPEFAALLADPNGDCDDNTKAFAAKYPDATLEFDGDIANIASHDGGAYVKDVLVENGGAGPAFQFSGITIQPGGRAPAALGLPANSPPLAGGDKVHIIAKVGDYSQEGCLFHLTPVSAKIAS